MNACLNTAMCLRSRPENIISWFNEIVQNAKVMAKFDFSGIFTTSITENRLDGRHVFVITLDLARIHGSDVKFTANCDNKSEALKSVYYQFWEWMNGECSPTTLAQAHMDSASGNTFTGPVNLVSQRISNTIVTSDAPIVEENALTPIIDPRAGLISLCSAEEIFQFNELVGRWVTIGSDSFSTTTISGGLVSWRHLITDVYQYIDSMPNSLPFKQFVFGKVGVMIKVVPNSHKFAQGRFVLGAIYDLFGQRGTISSMIVPTTSDPLHLHMTVQRPHAMIDLNESNDAILCLPFYASENAISTLPVVSGSIDYDGGYYATAYTQCLAPLRVPDTATSSVPYTWYIRFEDVSFLGMRRFIDPDTNVRAQAHGNFADKALDFSRDVMNVGKAIPGIGGLFSGTANVVGNGLLAITRPFAPPAFVKELEKNLNYAGVIRNRDKPISILPPTIVLPNAVGDLACGIGGEMVLPLRLDPAATTVLPDELDLNDTPEDVLDILRRLVLRSGTIGKYIFQWNISATAGTLLYSTRASILDCDSNTKDYLTAVGPATLTRFFAFQSGSVEFVFNIVGTQFHTGQLAIAFIPYMLDKSFETAQSCYIKYYDLREQKQCTFVLPYINNTIKRTTPINRTVNGFDFPYEGSVCVYVVNPLTPTQTVSTVVDVLVFQRAGTDFKLEVPIPAIQGAFDNVPAVSRLQNWVFPTGKIVAHMGDSNDSVSLSTVDKPISSYLSVSHHRLKKMADHAKEIGDASDNFGQVIPIPDKISHGEHHTDIKDLTRRWILGNSYSAFAAGTLYITVSPLSYVVSGFSSLQSDLMRCMKFGRGSVDYMFVLTSGSFDTARIRHIPFSLDFDYDQTATMKSSEAMALWVPKINPVIKVEVPFYTPYNFYSHTTALRDQAPSRSDILRSTGGYLKIDFSNASSTLGIDVYRRNGDDYQHALFNGIPACNIRGQTVTSTARLRKLEVSTKAQAHMPMLDTVQRGANLFVSSLLPWNNEEQVDASSPDAQYLNHPESVDLLPTPRAWSDFTDSARQRMSNSFASARSTLEAAGRVVTRMDNVSEMAEEVMTKVTEMTNKAIDLMKGVCGVLLNPSAMFTATLQFFQACINRTWTSFVIAITGMISAFGFFSTEVCQKILTFFSGLRKPPGDQQTGGIVAHCEHNCTHCPRTCHPDCTSCNGHFMSHSTWSTFGTLIFSAISGYLGVRTMKERGITAGLFTFSTNFWRTVSGAQRFMSDFVTLVNRCIQKCLSLSPETQEHHALSEDAGLEHFVSEVSLLTNAMNMDAISLDSNTKARFWMCVVSAYKYREKFSLHTTPQGANILRLCEKVIRLANELAVHAKACPVRYEPYVLGVEGPSKVGKSYLLQHALPRLLRDVYNIASYDAPVFCRTPGVEFWNGYSNQPAILYDDFLCTLDPNICAKQVIELFNLKSSAIMNLNMARLEEKELRGNPFIVSLATNSAFTVPNGVVTPSAFLRRRDALWKVELKSEYSSISTVPDEVKATFGHLTFKRFTDVTDAKSLSEEVCTYEQWYTIVRNEMKAYDLKERENTRKRLDSLRSLLPERARLMTEDADPFAVFYSAYTQAADTSPIQTGLLPSQILEEQLTAISSSLMDVGQNNDDPGSGISAHFDFGDIYQDMRSRMIQFLRGGQAPIITPQTECCVCYSTIFSDTANSGHFAYCQGGHIWCKTCDDIMQHVSRQDSNRHYSCPMCRSTHVCQNDTTTLWSALLFRLKRIGQNTTDFIRAVCTNQWFVQSVKLIYSALCIYLAVHRVSNLMVPTIATERNMSMVRTELTHENAFQWGIRRRFGIPFLVKKNFLPEDYVPFIGLPWGTYTNGGSYPPSYSNDFATILSRVNASAHMEPGIYGRLTLFNDLAQMKQQLINTRLRRDPLQRDMITVPGDCPHERLFNMDLGDVECARNDDNKVVWNIICNLFEVSETMPDAPCQHHHCPFRSAQKRLAFYGWWGEKHPDYVSAEIRTVTNTRTYLPRLPSEFFEAAFDSAVVAHQEQMLRTILGPRMTIWERLKDSAFSLWNKIKQYSGMMATIVGVLGSLVGAYKLFSWFSGNDPENVGLTDAHIINSGSMPTARLPRTNLTPRAPTLVRSHGGMPEDVMYRAIRRNTCFIQFKAKETTYNARCFGVFGRVLLINKHYISTMRHMLDYNKRNRQEFNISVVFHGVDINNIVDNTIPFSTLQITDCSNDLCALELPRIFPCFKDIRNYVATVDQHKMIAGECSLSVIEPKDGSQMVMNTRILGKNKDLQVDGTAYFSGYDLFDTYKIPVGRPGWCGSIMLSRQNSPICGIYSAGRTINVNVVEGFVVPLHRNFLNSLYDHFASEIRSDSQSMTPSSGEAHMKIPGKVYPLHRAAPAHIPSKTKIEPSMLQNVGGFVAKTQPAILSRKDPRWKHDGSPLYHGVLKHADPCLYMDQEIVDNCQNHLLQKILNVCRPLRDLSTPLTLNESICGLDLEYYTPMDFSTSAGYPWNLREGRKTKESWLELTRDDQGKVVSAKCDPELLSTLHVKRALREAGIRTNTVFLDCVKDERRKEKKIASPSGTRVFSLSPIDMSIESRQMFLDFSASYMTYRLLDEGCVGINVDGPEWTRLYERLSENSMNVVTGDYSDFGPRLPSQIVIAAFNIIRKWYLFYGTEDFELKHDKIRAVMAEEISQSDHIAHDLVYRAIGGIPSGHVLTSVLNSICNSLLIRYAWAKIFGNLLKFDDNVALCVYGDDLIMTVKKPYYDQFNAICIGEQMASFGMKFTDAQKTGILRHETFQTASFLKRGFLKHPTRKQMLAPIEELSVWECPQWVWKSPDLSEATRVNAEASLLLAYGHGPRFYKLFQAKLNAALRSVDLPSVQRTWHELDQMVWDSGDEIGLLLSKLQSNNF